MARSGVYRSRNSRADVMESLRRLLAMVQKILGRQWVSPTQVMSDGRQKSQSSSSVTTALPITYEDPEPEKKS